MTVLSDLAENRDAIDELEAQLDGLRADRDKLVARAREERIPYADISSVTGMSNSWITSSLVRTDGYQPRSGRPRRLE